MNKLILILPMLILSSISVSALYYTVYDDTSSNKINISWKNIAGYNSWTVFNSTDNSYQSHYTSTDPAKIYTLISNVTMGGVLGVDGLGISGKWAILRIKGIGNPVGFSIGYNLTTTDGYTLGRDCYNIRLWSGGNTMLLNRIKAGVVTEIGSVVITQPQTIADFQFYVENSRVIFTMAGVTKLNISDTNIKFSDGLAQFAAFAYEDAANSNSLKIKNISVVSNMTETTPPTLSDAICTSCTAGTNTSIDATPTINVTCTDNSLCGGVRISNNSWYSYNNATSSRGCSQGAGLTWVCTLPAIDQMTEAKAYTLYFWGNDTNSNYHIVYNLSISITYAPPVPPAAPFYYGYAVQYLETYSYNNTDIGFNLTVVAYNPNNETVFDIVTITPDIKYGSSATIQVAVNSSNQQSWYHNISRPMNDNWENITGAIITGNITMTTNKISMILPIDPPSVFRKEGIVDCSLNPEVNELTVLDKKLTFKNSNPYNTESCYQETANISTDCGGLNTGSYSCSGIFDIDSPCEYAFDGDNNTYASDEYGNKAYVAINYTKPIGSTSDSKWMVKARWASTNETNANISVSNCWGYYDNYLILNVTLSGVGSPSTSLYCFNGTWITLYTKTGYAMLYEETMWWDVKTPIKGLGYFLINSILSVTGFEKNETECIVALNGSGRLDIG